MSLPASRKNIADGAFSTAGGTPARTIPMIRNMSPSPSHNPSDKNYELDEDVKRTHNTASCAHIKPTRSGLGEASGTSSPKAMEDEDNRKSSRKSSTSAMEEVDDMLSMSLADTAFAFEFEEDCFLRFCSAPSCNESA